ncbi:YqaA family protein [Hyphomicrobium sp.]|uniref:YqaA family protein n=1 Tax=Hyphomicrobium sp. TaxID=82 RepID=UPI002CE649C4|nr:YqaA family protein [Hyphomicrobium sp.]HRN89145.1 YqaA family protein [Hyphomicrobium sp.]HRQ26997.1 YqaA family protein [Hyphomicrobium sp.]
MIRRLYDWTMDLARHGRAKHALFWISFIESSFFPIPPDVMLIPMVIAERTKAMLYASIATVGSVIGGIAGYIIGYFLFEQIGQPILELYGKADKVAEFSAWFNEWSIWILIVLGGLTPFPYKVLTITAGVTAMPILPFILASIAARASRFFLVAGLLYYFGPPIREFIERRLTMVTTVFVVLLIGGFVAVKYVV